MQELQPESIVPDSNDSGGHGMRPLLVYRKHTSLIECCAWSPSAQTIASSDLDARIHVWNSTDGATQVIYTGHEDLVRDIAFSPDGRSIATCGDDRTVHVWHTETGALQHIYRGHSLEVISIAWSPCGRFIASTDETTIHRWGARGQSLDEQVLVIGKEQELIFTDVLWTHDATRLVTTSEGSVQTWDAVTGKFLNLWDYKAEVHAILSLAQSPDGQQIAFADDDAKVRVVDARKGTTLLYHPVILDASWGLSWSPCGEHLASCGFDSVQVWDARSGETRCTYDGHDGNVCDVAWSPDGTQIASAGVDQTVQVWSPMSFSLHSLV